jgi:hypothetical protein
MFISCKFLWVGLHSWDKKEQAAVAEAKRKREEDDSKGWLLLICYQWFYFLIKVQGLT